MSGRGLGCWKVKPTPLTFNLNKIFENVCDWGNFMLARHTCSEGES